MEKYNLEKLVKVVVNDYCVARMFVYKTKETFLGITTQKEGVYDRFWRNFLSKEIPEYHVLKNGIIYEKPEVVLIFQSGVKKYEFFDTYESAKKYADEITKKGFWI